MLKSSLRLVESSLRFVEFKFASKESSLHFVESSLRFMESSLRFVESSLRFVESSFYRKNQVFVNACELHRTRYELSVVYINYESTIETSKCNICFQA